MFRAICPRPVRNGLPVEHREQSRAGSVSSLPTLPALAKAVLGHVLQVPWVCCFLVPPTAGGAQVRGGPRLP